MEQLEKCVTQLGSACDAGPKEVVQLTSARMEEAINSLDVIGKMKTFEEGNSQIPEFQAFGY